MKSFSLDFSMSTIFFREIDKLQEELVDSESVLDSKRKVRYLKFQSLRWVYFWLTKLLLHCCFFLYLDPFPWNSIYFLKDILAVVLCFLGVGKEKRKNFGAKITRFYVNVCVITWNVFSRTLGSLKHHVTGWRLKRYNLTDNFRRKSKIIPYWRKKGESDEVKRKCMSCNSLC